MCLMCNCVQFTPVNIYNWMSDNRKIHIISEIASNIMRYYIIFAQKHSSEQHLIEL